MLYLCTARSRWAQRRANADLWTWCAKAHDWGRIQADSNPKEEKCYVVTDFPKCGACNHDKISEGVGKFKIASFLYFSLSHRQRTRFLSPCFATLRLMNGRLEKSLCKHQRWTQRKTNATQHCAQTWPHIALTDHFLPLVFLSSSLLLSSHLLHNDVSQVEGGALHICTHRPLYLIHLPSMAILYSLSSFKKCLYLQCRNGMWWNKKGLWRKLLLGYGTKILQASPLNGICYGIKCVKMLQEAKYEKKQEIFHLFSATYVSKDCFAHARSNVRSLWLQLQLHMRPAHEHRCSIYEPFAWWNTTHFWFSCICIRMRVMQNVGGWHKQMDGEMWLQAYVISACTHQSLC